MRLRAQRLGVAASAVELAAETNVEDIIATISSDNSGSKRPDLVIIDSIQTLWTDMADSAPGTVTQVRSSAQAMIRYAKQTGAAVVLVGPCHQGRPDCRPARGGTHGRWRSLF